MRPTRHLPLGVMKYFPGSGKTLNFRYENQIEWFQAVAKFFAFPWHADGLSPYVVFEPVTDHGDTAIHKAQSWLSRHFSVANPNEQASRISGMPACSSRRRFKSCRVRVNRLCSGTACGRGEAAA
jgi:hypothetical protein